MAVLEGIRKKTGLLLIVVTGALVLFLIQGFASEITSFVRSDADQYAGKVGSERIKNDEYQQRYGARKALYEENYRRQNQQVPAYLDNQVKQAAWNDLLQKYAYIPTFREAGVVVTDQNGKTIDAEIVDMIQGLTVSEAVKRDFTEPEKGFDPSSVIRYLESIDKIEDEAQRANAEFRWSEITSTWVAERTQQKYSNLITKTNYVTKAEAKRKYFLDNSTVDFDHLYIPFSSIADDSIQIPDSELASYLSKNKNQFDAQDGRTLKYLVFDIAPTGQDSVSTLNQTNKIMEGFRTASNDTAYARSQSDVPVSPLAAPLADLPEPLQQDAAYLKKGYIKGPILSAQGYDIYKVVGTTNVEKAQTAHILINFGEDTVASKIKALDVLAKAKAGEDFGQLATEFSEDPGSKDNNGEYPAATRGQWVKPFENAVFDATRTGVVNELVETQFGFHIMKVLKTKFNEEQWVVLKITKNLKPSKPSRDAIFREASLIARDARSIEDLEEIVSKNENLSLESAFITRRSQSVGSVYNANSIVNWAHQNETEVGSVSSVYTIGNQYVIAALERITDKDNLQVNDVRDELLSAVRDQEKGKQLKTLLEKTQGDLYERLNKLNEQKGEGFCRYQEVKSHKYGSNSVAGAGNEPQMVGTAIAQDIDVFSKVEIGQAGVYIVRTKSKNEATQEIADYNAVISTIKNNYNNTDRTAINKAINEFVGVKDNRF